MAIDPFFTGIATSLIGGLLGGGKKSIPGIDESMQMNRDAANLQKKITLPAVELFTKFGLPTYTSAVNGLMSSYGYRPNSTNTEGSTVSQPSQQTTKTNPHAQLEAALAKLGFDRDYFLKHIDDVDAGNVNSQEGTRVANIIRSAGGDPNMYYSSLRDNTITENALSNIVPALSADGGEWGYYGQYGEALAKTTDEYDRAKQEIVRNAQARGLSDEVVNAALNQLDREKVSAIRELEVQSKREGPLAAINAIQPAFSLFAPMNYAPSNLSGIASGIQNSAMANQQFSQSNDNVMGALIASIVNMLNKTPSMGSSPNRQTTAYTPITNRSNTMGYNTIGNIISGWGR